MTRQEAINEIKSWDFLEGKEIEAIHTLIPELRESEDERIRKFLIDILSHSAWRKEWPFRPNEVVAYLEKQKEASKAIEAVDRIDKYIDEHVANAHDMKDSNPDKKYYRGWDDALGKMAGILQDVYSGKKQKETKPIYEDEYQKMLADSYNCGKDEVISNPEKYGLQKPAEWSEEDKRALNNAIVALSAYANGEIPYLLPSQLLEDVERLKSLRPHPKQEWSKEDEDPIKMEVYEVGKGTTICGQDYKCKKDYKEGNCWYIKDVIYHCSRDGYLTDQNGVSWSCTPEWFNEYIYTNSEWGDKEKNDFVSGQFIQCKLSFDEFKEGEHYWLEYVGDDMYVGRSDNILNQKFHITPRQLYTLFSQKLDVNEEEQKPRKFKLGDKVHRHDDDTNVITITGFRDGAYLADSSYGHILFCDECNYDKVTIEYITEDYVSFETAKLLEEKGFSEETVPFYEENGRFCSRIGNVYQPFDWNHDKRFIYYSAPTLQMVMKWLREVHKIFLNINFIQEHFCFTYRIIHNGVEEKFVVYSSTYEEACEAAIKYCLENLI